MCSYADYTTTESGLQYSDLVRFEQHSYSPDLHSYMPAEHVRGRRITLRLRCCATIAAVQRLKVTRLLCAEGGKRQHSWSWIHMHSRLGRVRKEPSTGGM